MGLLCPQLAMALRGSLGLPRDLTLTNKDHFLSTIVLTQPNSPLLLAEGGGIFGDTLG